MIFRRPRGQIWSVRATRRFLNDGYDVAGNDAACYCYCDEAARALAAGPARPREVRRPGVCMGVGGPWAVFVGFISPGRSAAMLPPDFRLCYSLLAIPVVVVEAAGALLADPPRLHSRRSLEGWEPNSALDRNAVCIHL